MLSAKYVNNIKEKISYAQYDYRVLEELRKMKKDE
jgi:hypothetical protein